MPDTPSITINKEMTYRGKPEVYSNTYHFSGTTPENDADWHALALAIWNAEKGFLLNSVKFVGYLGYNAGNNNAVSIKDYNDDGTAKPAAALAVVATTQSDPPGDVACWVRWRTPDRTSRGKRIYLRKYFHDVPLWGEAPSTDAITAMTAYGSKMIDGTLPGGVKVCGPQGAVASVPFVGPYSTTRTLKRRGKRPSS